MDPNGNINQDPLAATNNGATSFDPNLDMSAINEAVAAGGQADTIQNSFDVNDIDLANTPTTDGDLQKQLADDPSMNLANSASLGDESAPAQQPVAGFVDGDLADEPSAPTQEPAADAAAAPETAPMVDLSAAQEEISNPDEAAAQETPASDPFTPETPAIEYATTDLVTEPVAQEAEPATIADLANAAPADPTVTPAPEATPPVPATPATGKKSKMPTYILIGLSLIAIASVVVAVIVSLK